MEDNEMTIIAYLLIAPYKTGNPVYVLLIDMNTSSNQVNYLLVQPQDVGLERFLKHSINCTNWDTISTTLWQMLLIVAVPLIVWLWRES